MISLQFNNTISERDMDLLFVQAALTNPGFCRMLIDKTRLKGRPFHIINAELSKTDNDLGESIVEITGVFKLWADDPFAFSIDIAPLPSFGCRNWPGLEIKERSSDLAEARPADDVPCGVHQSVTHVIAASRPKRVHESIIR